MNATEDVQQGADEVRGIAPRDPYEPIPPEMWARLHAAWPNGTLLTTAWRIARDVETLADLLAGYSVDADRLDAAELARALCATHVQLVAPLDVVELGVAA